MSWELVLAVGLALAAVLGVLMFIWGSRRRDAGPAGDVKQVPTNYPSIQGAINAASEGDVIVVLPGIYQEDLLVEDKNLTIRGRDPEDDEVVAATILQGTGLSSVITISGDGHYTCHLEGLTVTGGRGNVERGPNTLGPGCRAGGGIAVKGSAGATMDRLVVRENEADLGGGLYLDVSAAVTLRKCLIEGNRAHLGGGIRVGDDFAQEVAVDPFASTASLEPRSEAARCAITDCDIVANGASIGAGLSVSGRAAPTISRSRISQNQAALEGGGIAIWNGARAHLEGNRIQDNRVTGDYAFGGGASSARGARPIIHRNSFQGNQVQGDRDSGGGGLWVHQSAPVLSGNRFRRNWGDRRGGAIDVRAHSEAVLRKNRLSANSATAYSGIYLDSTSRASGPDAKRLTSRDSSSR